MTLFQGDDGASVTLAAATPLVTTLATGKARTWVLHVRNTGGTNAITALRYRRRLRAADTVAGPYIAITTDIPIAAGAAWEMRVGDDGVEQIDVELTSTSGTTATLSLVGV
jgi:hypothetical protein